ncbi:unnamed protein product, partial [Notodromas monacha]
MTAMQFGRSFLDSVSATTWDKFSSQKNVAATSSFIRSSLNRAARCNAVPAGAHAIGSADSIFDIGADDSNVHRKHGYSRASRENRDMGEKGWQELPLNEDQYLEMHTDDSGTGNKNSLVTVRNITGCGGVGTVIHSADPRKKSNDVQSSRKVKKTPALPTVFDEDSEKQAEELSKLVSNKIQDVSRVKSFTPHSLDAFVQSKISVDNLLIRLYGLQSKISDVKVQLIAGISDDTNQRAGVLPCGMINASSKFLARIIQSEKRRLRMLRQINNKKVSLHLRPEFFDRKSVNAVVTFICTGNIRISEALYRRFLNACHLLKIISNIPLEYLLNLKSKVNICLTPVEVQMLRHRRRCEKKTSLNIYPRKIADCLWSGWIEDCTAVIGFRRVFFCDSCVEIFYEFNFALSVRNPFAPLNFRVEFSPPEQISDTKKAKRFNFVKIMVGRKRRCVKNRAVLEQCSEVLRKLVADAVDYARKNCRLAPVIKFNSRLLNADCVIAAIHFLSSGQAIIAKSLKDDFLLTMERLGICVNIPDNIGKNVTNVDLLERSKDLNASSDSMSNMQSDVTYVPPNHLRPFKKIECSTRMTRSAISSSKYQERQKSFAGDERKLDEVRHNGCPDLTVPVDRNELVQQWVVTLPDETEDLEEDAHLFSQLGNTDLKNTEGDKLLLPRRESSSSGVQAVAISKFKKPVDYLQTTKAAQVLPEKESGSHAIAEILSLDEAEKEKANRTASPFLQDEEAFFAFDTFACIEEISSTDIGNRRSSIGVCSSEEFLKRRNRGQISWLEFDAVMTPTGTADGNTFNAASTSKDDAKQKAFFRELFACHHASRMQKLAQTNTDASFFSFLEAFNVEKTLWTAVPTECTSSENFQFFCDSREKLFNRVNKCATMRGFHSAASANIDGFQNISDLAPYVSNVRIVGVVIARSSVKTFQ